MKETLYSSPICSSPPAPSLLILLPLLLLLLPPLLIHHLLPLFFSPVSMANKFPVIKFFPLPIPSLPSSFSSTSHFSFYSSSFTFSTSFTSVSTANKFCHYIQPCAYSSPPLLSPLSSLYACLSRAVTSPFSLPPSSNSCSPFLAAAPLPSPTQLTPPSRSIFMFNAYQIKHNICPDASTVQGSQHFMA